jgi:plasmid maintenance system antidote protein VapI
MCPQHHLSTGEGTTMPKQRILIPIEVGEDYQDSLLRRLEEYDIKQREVAMEMGISETQFSRWVARPSADTNRPMAIRIDNVIAIEKAILAIRARKKRRRARHEEK